MLEIHDLQHFASPHISACATRAVELLAVPNSLETRCGASEADCLVWLMDLSGLHCMHVRRCAVRSNIKGLSVTINVFL
jgi:hypothetical protein